jgi:uncharacterized protein YycO
MNQQKNRICFAQPTKNYHGKANIGLNSNNSLYKTPNAQLVSNPKNNEKENVISQQQSLLKETDENTQPKKIGNYSDITTDKNENNDYFVSVIDQLMFGNFPNENNKSKIATDNKNSAPNYNKVNNHPQNPFVFGLNNRGIQFITPHNKKTSSNTNKVTQTKINNKLFMNLEQQIQINNLRMLQHQQIKRALINTK